MSHSPVSKLAERKVDPITSDLEGWKKVEGSPTMRTWIEYSSDAEGLMAGWWEATPGTYHATYTAWEYVHMIEGRITITPDGGDAYEVGPDDVFVIEAEFEGTWEITEKVLKHFVMKT